MRNPRRTVTRRQALGALAHGSLGALLAPSLLPGLIRAAPSAGSTRRLVLLWLEGGPSQFETFDPKPGTATGGPTQALATEVAGWHFAASLPGLARRAEHLAVVRSMTSREGNHSRARAFVKTGHVPNPTLSYPTLGSMVSYELGDVDSDLPEFIQVGGGTADGGYLGVEHAPLLVPKAGEDIGDIEHPRGVDAERVDRRARMLETMEEAFETRGGSRPVQARRALRERARRLMDTPLRQAFELDQEKEALRDAYGRHDFGQGCLLARRLLEADVNAVEVVLGGWDTHNDNFLRTTELGAQLDQGFSTLLDDLGQRGLLEETLILCLGEFGRTPRITATDGRGHWPGNWCVALAGAGLRTGQALGRTDDTGETIVERPITVPDLFATTARILGLNGSRQFVVRERPVTLVDAEGQVVEELLA